MDELLALEANGRLRLVSGPQGPRVLLDGKPALLLCSDNYLGLADHPRVREAAADAAMRWGTGAGAPRLVSGSMTIHRRLEERLASFSGSEACVLFGSGYLASMGAIAALAGPGDVIFSDELNNDAIVDACRLSEAQVVAYRHRDTAHLEWCMRRHRGERESFVVTDSVFPVEASTAPLLDLVELASAFGARVIVDEAHAMGALGPGGRGALAAAGLEDAVDVVLGTLGKALGSYGGYACGREEIVRGITATARPLSCSTAPAPTAVAAALAALELIESRPHRVERLGLAARTLRGALGDEGFAVAESELPMVSLLEVGDERITSELAEGAIERGVFVQAILPPAMLARSARLRITVMASHTPRELCSAARVLGQLADQLGVERASICSPELAAGAPMDIDVDAHPRGFRR